MPSFDKSERKPRIWANGGKEKFLLRQLEQYGKALQLDKISEFYTLTTNLWIQKFGWHFDPSTDVPEDTPDPPPQSLEDDVVSDEECTKRRAYFLAMRTVSGSVID